MKKLAKLENSKAQILRLIRKGESETVEFKESFGTEVIETTCAFANAKGGIILIGVDDRGNVKGVQIGKSSTKDWINRIAQGTGVHPSVGVIRVGGNKVVRIEVEGSRIKPVMFHGRVYKRVGDTTRQMSVEELTRIVLDSVGATWDELPEPRASMEDIDPSKIRAFVRLANETRRRPIEGRISPSTLLEKLDLIREGKLSRAAVLLFGKRPQKYYLQAMIKAGRFRSEDLIVDDREIEGSLFEQVEGAMNYFREKLETRFEMTGRPQRKVIWEYPLDSLREAVINAVCHRDYMESGQTQVRIYDDRVMIWNSGG